MWFVGVWESVERVERRAEGETEGAIIGREDSRDVEVRVGIIPQSSVFGIDRVGMRVLYPFSLFRQASSRLWCLSVGEVRSSVSGTVSRMS